MKKKLKMNKKNMRLALSTIYRIRKEYIWVLITTAILNAVKPFIPIVLSAKILDELLGSKDTQVLGTLVALLVGSMFLIHIVSSYLNKKYSDESKLLVSHYYFELSKKTMRMKYDHIEKKETMDLIHEIEGTSNSYMAIWNIAEYMQKGLLAFIEIMIAGGLMITMLISNGSSDKHLDAFINSPIAFALLGLVLLVGLYLYSFLQGKLGETAANDMKDHVIANRIFGYLFFYMSSNYEHGKDIRLYNAQDLLHEKMKRFVQGNYKECDEEFVKPNIKHYSLLSIVNVAMLMAVYVFIVMKAYVGAITVGAIFVQVNAIMRLYGSFGSFLTQYNMLKASLEHFKHSVNYFDLPETKNEGQKDIEDVGHYIFEFKDVSFKYPSSEDWVLKKINLTIETNERLSVVGMNGAGKTTMIKLLCRLYEPSEGIITLNGVNIKDYDYTSYINLFSVVFQDFQLFSFDMDKNVMTGEIGDEKLLKESLKDAGLKTLVEELNGHINVPIGKNFDENGRDFSGGERQKLAIARALYRNTPIVVLDEPTAALDPIAEFEIYNKFNNLIKEKTAIFISHRLSSCRFSKNIAVFHKGQIVQLGNHDTLMENESGKYHELWTAQAKHYVFE